MGAGSVGGYSTRQGWLWIVTAVLLTVGGWGAVLVPRATALRADTTNWTGTISDMAGANVILVVDYRKGRAVTVSVSAHDLPLVCDDGSSQVRDLPPFTARFHSKRSFIGESYVLDDDLTVFERFTGRLDRKSAAHGTLTYLHDPFDPPAGPDSPECSTGGPVSWTAVRYKR